MELIHESGRRGAFLSVEIDHVRVTWDARRVAAFVDSQSSQAGADWIAASIWRLGIVPLGVLCGAVQRAVSWVEFRASIAGVHCGHGPELGRRASLGGLLRSVWMIA